MKNYTIIHNPRCSKSREALALLQSKGLDFEIIEYLNGELTPELLNQVMDILQVPLKELLRTKEEEFKNLNIDLENREAVIEAIIKHPKLLERPIIIKGEQAVIGRPPEKVLSLLQD